MRQKEKLRADLVSGGSFLAVPSAYRLASDTVRNAIKLEIRPVYSATGEDETELVFFSNRVLVDLGAVETKNVDIAKIIADCDLVKKVVSRYPDGVQKILAGLQANTLEGIREADKVAKEIGLTEEDSIKSGGGLFFLAIAAIAIVALPSCVKKGDTMKPGDESTMPGHGISQIPDTPGDAGTGDAGPIE